MQRDQRGFALVLAILTLVLLTLMGLAVAAGSSVDLQVATNYRWERQAFYNAEAGLEVGRVLLRGMSWGVVLPPARALSWPAATAPPAPPSAPFARAHRNFESGNCDTRGAGVGYGVVLDDGGAAAPYEDITTTLGHSLNGAFTLWVRRPVVVHDDGTASDDPRDDRLVLTVEGAAPFTRPDAPSAYARSQATTRLLEATLSRQLYGLGWDVRLDARRDGSTACH